MNIALAGFRHNHIYTLVDWISKTEHNILYSWETDEESIKIANDHGISITHSDFDEMISQPDIDIVAIGDYFSARGEKIIKSLEKGKHVICDKPICTDINELNIIKELSVKNNLKVGCMLDLRCKFAPNKAREIISSGRLGKVNNIIFTGQHCLNYGKRPSWYFENGKQGGTINDIAIHGIDLVNFMTGLEVDKVNFAKCRNVYAVNNSDFLDCAQFSVELTNGAGLLADVSYAAPSVNYTVPQYWRFTLWCDNGVLEFNYADDVLNLYLAGEEKPLTFSGDKTISNPFTLFIDDIKGIETTLTSERVLKSAEDTLKIQKYSEGVK